MSKEEAQLLEQLRANARMQEHLRALLECAMAEHMGAAGADEAEEHIARHVRGMGLAALTGWATQTEEHCAQQLKADQPDARRRTKKK